MAVLAHFNLLLSSVQFIILELCKFCQYITPWHLQKNLGGGGNNVFGEVLIGRAKNIKMVIHLSPEESIDMDVGFLQNLCTTIFFGICLRFPFLAMYILRTDIKVYYYCKVV